MEKFKHLSHMFNVRTKRKKYENFIVNAIYNRVGNSELMPVTQQYVKSKKDNRYYLLDLYFPQINYGVEVDELQHKGTLHEIADEERENAIKEAIFCTEKRVQIYPKTGEDKSVEENILPYEKIEAQINECVAEIQELIKKTEEASGKKLKWLSNDERKAQVWEKGVISINDNVSYRGIQEIAQLLGYVEHGHCGKRIADNYYIWVPHLAVEDVNGKQLSKKGWTNILTNDREGLIEIDVNNKLKKPDVDFEPTLHRVVFMKMRDKFGKECCEFIGVFKPEECIPKNADGYVERRYKRIATEIQIDLLKKKY